MNSAIFSENPVRPAHPPVAILGVPFDRVTLSDTINLIEQMIASRQSHYLATANVDFVVQAQRDLELRRILSEAALVLCDGTPLVWASRWLGDPLPERVAGADLVPELIRVAAEKEHRIFLLGATPEAAQRAVDKLRRDHPALKLVGSCSPPFAPLLEMDHENIVRQIREAHPDLLFVSFGCPKQEKWIAMHYRELGVPVSIGVGATIDFLGGHMRRAPRWMQRSGTEWIFRLLQEPRRLYKRYASDLVVFGGRILRQCLSIRRARRDRSSPSPVRLRANGWVHVRLPFRFDQHLVARCQEILDLVLSDRRNCVVEMGGVGVIDSAGVGWLLQLRKFLRAQGRELILMAPRRNVRRTLAFMGVIEFFSIAGSLQAARKLHVRQLHEELHPATGRGPLVWQGEIIASNVREIVATTLKQLRDGGGEPGCVDLSRVRYLDSAAALAMSELVEAAREVGVSLRFINARPAVRNVLRFARREHLISDEPAVPRTRRRSFVPSRQAGS